MKSIAIFGLLGVIGAGLYIGLYEQAFPQATLHVAVTADEAGDRAEDFLSNRGVDAASYTRASGFESDYGQEVFLQRSLGFEEFNAYVEQDIDYAPWWFKVRFFKELEPEEYSVFLNTNGEITGFSHTLPESVEGARLSEAEARTIVENYAEEQLGIDLSTYEHGSYKSNTDLPNRIDHSFDYYLPLGKVSWSDDPSKAQGAKMLSFDVAGDEISYYNTNYFVPEEFIKQQQTEDSYGDLFLLIAGIVDMALLIAAITIILFRFRNRDLRGMPFLALSLALAAIALSSTFLYMEGSYYFYDTTLPWMTFITQNIVGTLIFTSFAAVGLFIYGIAGETLTREVFPRANDFDRENPKSARTIWTALARGTAFGLLMLGYITLFYVIAPKFFGVWSPLDVSFADFFASPVPFLAIIGISLGAALGEELAFRYFGVSLLKKYAKYTWVALLIPAIIWAFLHSTYPVYPMYVRGIELTIAGIAFGLIFMRYGIFTAIVAHYVVDIVLFATPLLLADRLYLIASGGIAIASILLLPFLYLFAMRLRLPRLASTKPLATTEEPKDYVHRL